MRAVVTLTKPANVVGEARRQFGKRSLAGLVLVVACAFSSATAAGGIREYSKENSDSAAEQSSADPDSVALPLRPANPVSDEVKLVPDRIDSLLNDPSADNSFSRSLFLANNPAPSLEASDKTEVVVPAASPKTAKSPLLIPLPTAISAGMSGLIALALLLAPRRLRRRILA